MTGLAELNHLQNKRSNNAPETNLIVMEINRRKRIIEEIGADAPVNDTLVGVLWMAMDQATRTNVSSQIDAQAVVYSDL